MPLIIFKLTIFVGILHFIVVTLFDSHMYEDVPTCGILEAIQ